MSEDEELYSVDQPVTVRFDVDEQDVDKVFKAERLLREAGVMFDTGSRLMGPHAPAVNGTWTVSAGQGTKSLQRARTALRPAVICSDGAGRGPRSRGLGRVDARHLDVAGAESSREREPF